MRKGFLRFASASPDVGRIAPLRHEQGNAATSRETTRRHDDGPRPAPAAARIHLACFPRLAGENELLAMATIRPFRARRYSAAAGHIADLVAPPYDVIDAAQRQRYLANSSHNIARLTLGGLPENPEDTGRHVQAADLFAAWAGDGLLPPDPEPSYYVYEQAFDLPDEGRLTRRGLTALLHLEDFESAIVVPHEHTFGEIKEDRLKLLSACRASFSDIFVLYSDPERELDAMLDRAVATPPIADVEWQGGERHRLWRIADDTACQAVTAAVADHRLVIADGHHRYETALTYRNLQRERSARPNGPWEWVNVFIANSDAPGLVVLPCHRLIPRSIAALDQLPERARQWFDVTEIPMPADAAHSHALAAVRPASDEEQVFGLYHRPGSLLRLSSRDRAAVGRLITEAHSDRWRALDVSVLHGVIIRRLLGISREHEAEHVSYEARGPQALRAVHEGDQVLLLLNPPDPADILAIALEGERLPHKATYFYPKLLAGLVIRDHRID